MTKINLEKLQSWKEILIQLPENKFLNLVRMYIGAVKTPYNKERLIHDLTVFLHKEENKHTLIHLLSERDIMILNAVSYISKPGKKKLTQFFDGVFSVFELYEYLANLEERLLLFRCADENAKSRYFVINPLLKENILPFIKITVLLPVANMSKKISATELNRQSNNPVISAKMIAAWYAFIAQNPDACRADGSFKKKTIEQIERIFHAVPADFAKALHKSSVNLSLFTQENVSISANDGKWKSFGNLSAIMQYAYMSVAGCGYFPRDMLVKYANFTLNFLANIPPEGYTRIVLNRLGFLLQNMQKEDIPTRAGTFSKILQKAHAGIHSEGIFSVQTLIDTMILFGIIKVAGKDKDGNEIFINHLPINTSPTEENTTGYISIDAGFSVSLLGETSLKNLLELVSCMELESCDTICRYVITRNACLRCFELGQSADVVLQNLEQACNYALPQNLRVSIEEWYKTYSSAALFEGFILQVAEESQAQTENDRMLSSHIKKIIAPGIYLLDFATKAEALACIQKSTLDFIKMPKTLYAEQKNLPFSDFSQRVLSVNFHNDDFHNCETISPDVSDEDAKNHVKKMKNLLDTMNISEEQKEELADRIDRRIILTSAQLTEDSVRPEKTEASGMDFVGKIHVIEQAMTSLNMLEIKTGENTYTGFPEKIEKGTGDASLWMTIDDTKEVIKISVGQAGRVKRLRSILFKEK